MSGERREQRAEYQTVKREEPIRAQGFSFAELDFAGFSCFGGFPATLKYGSTKAKSKNVKP